MQIIRQRMNNRHSISNSCRHNYYEGMKKSLMQIHPASQAHTSLLLIILLQENSFSFSFNHFHEPNPFLSHLSYFFFLIQSTFLFTKISTNLYFIRIMKSIYLVDDFIGFFLASLLAFLLSQG
jgi:hypothetical protein